MFREFAHNHPLLFIAMLCTYFGMCWADRVFAKSDGSEAPIGMLVAGGAFVSAIACAI